MNRDRYHHQAFPFDELAEMLDSALRTRRAGGYFDLEETLHRARSAVAAGNVPEGITQKLRDDGFRTVALMCRQFQAHAERKNARKPPAERQPPGEVSFALPQRTAAELRGIEGDDRTLKSKGESTLNRLVKVGIIEKVDAGRAHKTITVPTSVSPDGKKTIRGKGATWRYTGPDPEGTLCG